MTRKKKLKVEKTEPATQCGVTIGEVVWCIVATGNIGHGRIVNIHPLNKEGPAVTIYDQISGACRVGLISGITSESPNKSNLNKLAKAKAKAFKQKNE
jgi:hypothetical protein